MMSIHPVVGRLESHYILCQICEIDFNNQADSSKSGYIDKNMIKSMSEIWDEDLFVLPELHLGRTRACLTLRNFVLALDISRHRLIISEIKES